MAEELTIAQRQRLHTLWDVAQNDPKYYAMLQELRVLEKQYEDVIEKLEDGDRNVVCDFVSLCEGMSWRILEIASQRMRFQFEREE